MMAKKKQGEASWTWRRAIIFPVVIWACYELHILINAPDTRVNETIAYGWQILIAILILGYTGFATVQDIAAIWRTGRAQPYVEGNGYSATAEAYTPPPEPYTTNDTGMAR
jgi:hypothetical protein